MRLAIVALLLPMSLAAQSSRWLEITPTLLVDTTTIATNGQQTQVWLKLVANDAMKKYFVEQYGKSVSYGVLQVESSCSDRTITIGVGYYYNASNELEETFPAQLLPSSVAPDSRGESWYTLVCAVAAARRGLVASSKP